ncbi:MAG TPA: VOC family protein [Candidatus Dormibacteraeota bacterium]|nr:VOC family protein [Candidatus Dormibacteraeota bacterium]
MASAVFNITFDCNDARLVAQFWSAATGYELAFIDTPGNPFWLVSPRGGQWPRLVFVTVPEPKSVKNRVHLDLMPEKREQEAELSRLIALGARIVDDRRKIGPGGWIVLADPEGNEFCLE